MPKRRVGAKLRFDVENVTESELIALLSRACDKAGGQRTWAASAGISQQYVSDVLSGKRRPGDAICRALGYERQSIYVKKDIWEENKR